MKYLLIIVITMLGFFYIVGESAHIKKTENAMYRSTFKEAIFLKTKDEVIAAVGRPDTTQQSGQTEYWNYHEATRDVVTGNIDRSAQVVIEDGRVKAVNF